jgi:hypothetical protein
VKVEDVAGVVREGAPEGKDPPIFGEPIDLDAELGEGFRQQTLIRNAAAPVRREKDPH